MASQRLLEGMKTVLDGIAGVDKDQLLRSRLGEESLEQAGFAKALEEITRKASFALQYGAFVDENTGQVGACFTFGQI